MKRKHRKAMSNYIRYIADRMGLRDWEFTVRFDNDGSSDVRNHVTLACIFPTYGRRQAYIDFGPDVRKIDPCDLRMIVVHELAHCHIAAAQGFVEDDLLPSVLGKTARKVAHKAFRRFLEHAVDGIATAWAEDMPLIDWKNTGEA